MWNGALSRRSRSIVIPKYGTKRVPLQILADFYPK